MKSESEVAQSCPTLCDPIDCSLLGSSVHGIFQAIVLEWMDISFSRDLPNPGMKPRALVSPALAGGFFTTGTALEAQFYVENKANFLKAMAPHSSTLAWKIPWMEEPGGLQSMGSLRVGHD